MARADLEDSAQTKRIGFMKAIVGTLEAGRTAFRSVGELVTGLGSSESKQGLAVAAVSKT